MADLLKPYIGKSGYHLSSSAMFVQAVDDLRLLVSLDIVLLFTKVPLEPLLKLLNSLFPLEVVKLFEFHLLYVFNGQVFEQTEGAVMGSLLFPMVADFFNRGF